MTDETDNGRFVSHSAYSLGNSFPSFQEYAFWALYVQGTRPVKMTWETKLINQP